MELATPPLTSVRQKLKGLNYAGVEKLSLFSDVPKITVLKIRDGTTKAPGYETVRKMLPYVESLLSIPAYQSRQRLKEQAQHATQVLSDSAKGGK